MTTRRAGRGRCQQRVSTNRTHQRRRAWWRHSGAVPYNSRTTRRAPTGAYQRLRQLDSAVPIRSCTRANADERRPARMGVGALITRRSQVQILPPPPSNTRSEALSERLEGASRRWSANTARTSANTMSASSAHGEPCDAFEPSLRPGVSRFVARRTQLTSADLRVVGPTVARRDYGAASTLATRAIRADLIGLPCPSGRLICVVWAVVDGFRGVPRRSSRRLRRR